MKFQQLIRKLQQKQIKNNIPIFSLGDTLCVGVLIQEGNKQRIQTYQGVFIAQHRAARRSTITIRRIFQGIGIERIFLIHSSSIQFIEVKRCVKVRRSKLYYLKNIKGKAARLREKIKITSYFPLYYILNVFIA
jgi:large subunit ribosomal protein L19